MALATSALLSARAWGFDWQERRDGDPGFWVALKVLKNYRDLLRKTVILS
jgi:hypothetical protein